MYYVCMLAKSLQLCPTVCNPMDCSLPDSSFHAILQAKILEWVAIPFSRGSSQHRDQTRVSCISCVGRQFLYQFFLIMSSPHPTFLEVITVDSLRCIFLYISVSSYRDMPQFILNHGHSDCFQIWGSWLTILQQI